MALGAALQRRELALPAAKAAAYAQGYSCGAGGFAIWLGRRNSSGDGGGR